MRRPAQDFLRKATAIVAIAAAAVLASTDAAVAQISVDATMLTSGYSQNFDSLGTSTTATLPTGWKFTAAGAGTTAGWSTAANVTATTQGASSGGPTGGGIYNWGSTTTDRSPGFMTSGSYASPNGLLFGLTNSTTSTITGLTLAFDYERYRINTAAASVTFFGSTDGSTWTAVTAGDSGAFATGTSTYTFTGGTVVNKTGISISSLNIGQNQSYYLKWNFNTTGTSSQGIGLDNFTASFTSSSGGGGANYYWVGADTTLGGAGTWTQTAGTAWRPTADNGTGAAWDSTKIATFGGDSAGTVTVSDTVTANAGLSFATTGYTLTGGTVSLGGANAAANTITTATATAIDSVITGSSGLTKAGVGALTLGGANTYSGGTIVSAGTLVGTTSSLQGAITNNAAVTFSQATDGTYTGIMSGSGSLTKLGAGNITLSGANTYSGGTTVSAGTLTGSTTSLQRGIVNNAAVAFDQNSDGTYSGIMSGTGSLTKLGTGNVTLGGANTYSGATTVSAGTLSTAVANAVSGNVAIAAGATLALGAAQDLTTLTGSGTLAAGSSAITVTVAGSNTFAGTLTGGAGASLAKAGPGTLSLTGDAAAYAGSLRVSAGTITGSSFGTGPLAMTAGAAYGTPGGTIANAITIADVSSSVWYAQNFNGIAGGLPTGWTTRTGADAGSAGSNAAPTLTAVAWNSSTGQFANFASATGLTSSSDTTAQAASANRALGVRQTGSFGDPGAAISYAFSTTGQAIDSITFDMMMLDVQGRSGTWSIQYGSGAAPTAFTTLGTWETPATWGTTPLTFSGPAVSGMSNLENVVVRVVALSSSTGSGSRDTIAIDNFQINTGTAAPATARLGIAEAGATEFNGGVAVTGTAELFAAAGGTATFSGAITGASGEITKLGPGRVVLSGTNTYSGGMTVSAGTLSVAADAALGGSAGGITLGGGALELTNGFTLGSGRTITAATGTSSTIAVTSGTVSFAGPFTGSGNLDKAGAGTLSLGNASTGYSGTFTISAGTLEVTAANAFANATLTQTGGTLLLAPVGGGDVVIPELGGSGGEVRVDSGASAVFRGNANRAYDGRIRGQGAFKKEGNGILTLNADNDFTGNTRITQGRLKLGAGGGLSATPRIDIDSGAIFDVADKSGFALGTGQRLGGRGTVVGDLQFGSGSQLAFDPAGPLLVGSGAVSFAAGFGIGSIFGFDSTVAEGTYTLLNETTGGSINFAGLANVGPGNPFDLGGGKSAYFQQGSLQVVVVPEPDAFLVGGLGLALAGLMLGRRRSRPLAA